MDKFKEWFVSQYFYSNMRFVHGDALFDKDGDFFRILAVQIAWEAWQSRQAEVDQLKGLLEKDEYAHSLYYENLNLQTSIDEKDERIETALALIDTTSYSEIQRRMPDFIDQLKNALRGEHEKD